MLFTNYSPLPSFSRTVIYMSTWDLGNLSCGNKGQVHYIINQVHKHKRPQKKWFSIPELAEGQRKPGISSRALHYQICSWLNIYYILLSKSEGNDPFSPPWPNTCFGHLMIGKYFYFYFLIFQRNLREHDPIGAALNLPMFLLIKNTKNTAGSRASTIKAEFPLSSESCKRCKDA